MNRSGFNRHYRIHRYLGGLYARTIHSTLCPSRMVNLGSQLLVKPEVERRLYGAIIEKCREMKCAPIRIGGVPDHLHLLVRLNPAVTVSDLIREVKGSSSHLMTHQINPGDFFKWQGAYAAFSLRYEEVPKIKEYIAKQKIHHTSNELLLELEKMEINDASELDIEELTDDEEIMGGG